MLPAFDRCLNPSWHAVNGRWVGAPCGYEADFRVVIGQVPAADSPVRSSVFVPLLPDDDVFVGCSPSFDDLYGSGYGALNAPKQEDGIGFVRRFVCVDEFAVRQCGVGDAGCPVRPRWVAGDDGEASLLWVFLTKGVG